MSSIVSAESSHVVGIVHISLHPNPSLPRSSICSLREHFKMQPSVYTYIEQLAVFAKPEGSCDLPKNDNISL